MRLLRGKRWEAIVNSRRRAHIVMCSVAALAACQADEPLTASSSAAVCTDNGGGPGALVRTIGMCREVELLPMRMYGHAEVFDAQLPLQPPFRFTLPAEISVVAGNAGNHDAHLKFIPTSGPEVDCTYRGGSSQAHPTSSAEILKGKKYLFVSCADGTKAGDVRTTIALALGVDGDNRDPARATVARLVLNEVAPCGPPVDAGADADAASDASDAGDASAEADAKLDASADADGSADAEASAPDSDADDHESQFCGDGIRDPVLEECDLGSDTSARLLCTADCRVNDALLVIEPTDAATPPGRTLGEGRHPIAVGSSGAFGVVFVESDASPLRLALSTFGGDGAASDVAVPISAGSLPLFFSNPVVAPVPGGKYAVAYTDFNGDGDELGVSLRLVDPAHPPTGIPTHANTTTTFSQYDADLIATPSGLVAAWLDDSDPATAPDIKYRTFGFDLTPTSSEQLLSNAVANEGDVTLAPWGSGWAIAWRAGENGLETLRIQSGSTQWSVGPFLPGPVGARPGLVELDATHLLVVYTEGIDPADTGVANASKLRAAVLDLNAPTTVTPFDIPSSLPGRAGLSQDQPNAMRAGGQVFIAWRTETALASAAGEELWLKEIGWNGTSIDLERGELQLPRLPNSPPGDQRHPGLAAGPLSQNGEQLVAAFDDLGKLFGAEEGQGDIVVEAIPIPLVRLADEP